LNAPNLIRFFEARKERGEPLVLVTVFETQGSTYSKTGAQMLIDGDAVFHGMLSGGCLEGDLAIRAATVIETGTPQVVAYDLAQDDELWGLGVGCDGLMRVFLQPLDAEGGYQPFATIADLLLGDRLARLAIVIESDAEDMPPGATVIRREDELWATGMSIDVAKRLLAREPQTVPAIASVAFDAGSATVLFTDVLPPPRLLLLGAGMDAEPIVRFACELGWRCTVVDHRDTYVERGEFAGAEQVLCLPAEDLADALDLSKFDAAVVMSHHLVSDRAYLRQLATANVAYVGLLGPANRRERLVSELGDDAAGLIERLHGPAGLDIGGRGPAAIALSIIAEVQGVLQRA